MEATAKLPALVSSVGFLTTPAVSLLIAVALLHEPLTLDLIVGSLLIMTSVRRCRLARTKIQMILHAIQAGEGPPIVLLHGLFGAARNFGMIQRALASRYRTIALDMRNHGESPHASDMRYPTQAEDVRDTLRLPGRRDGGGDRPLDGRKGRHGAGAAVAAAGRPPAGRRYRAGDLPARQQFDRPGHAGDPADCRADPAASRRGAGRHRAPPGRAGVPAAEPAAGRVTPLAHRLEGDCRRNSRSGGLGRSAVCSILG